MEFLGFILLFFVILYILYKIVKRVGILLSGKKGWFKALLTLVFLICIAGIVLFFIMKQFDRAKTAFVDWYFEPVVEKVNLESEERYALEHLQEDVLPQLTQWFNREGHVPDGTTHVPFTISLISDDDGRPARVIFQLPNKPFYNSLKGTFIAPGVHLLKGDSIRDMPINMRLYAITCEMNRSLESSYTPRNLDVAGIEFQDKKKLNVQCSNKMLNKNSGREGMDSSRLVNATTYTEGIIPKYPNFCFVSPIDTRAVNLNTDTMKNRLQAPAKQVYVCDILSEINGKLRSNSGTAEQDARKHLDYYSSYLTAAQVAILKEVIELHSPS